MKCNTAMMNTRRRKNRIESPMTVLLCTSLMLVLSVHVTAFPSDTSCVSRIPVVSTRAAPPPYQPAFPHGSCNPTTASTRWTRLELSRDRSGGVNNNSDNDNDRNNKSNNKSERNKRLGRKEGRRNIGSGRLSSTAGLGFGMVSRRSGGANSTTTASSSHSSSSSSSSAAVMDHAPDARDDSPQMQEMAKRMTQLEHLVAKQNVEIRKLKEECKSLNEASEAFHEVIELLRAAGLQTDDDNDNDNAELPSSTSETNPQLNVVDEDDVSTTTLGTNNNNYDNRNDEESMDRMTNLRDDDVDDEEQMTYEYFDDLEIFGEAPSSVTDAADHAGASILAGLLGGKQRMLVDVRDSELSRDPETLVQFIELAILPVAAGLEGMISKKNRVKLVFPTVSQLLQYRKTMALAAPEVVALSTLGFDPVEDTDNIVVIIAPSPDDEEGLQVMNELLEPPEWKKDQRITQPVVILNHHMVPLSGPAATYDVMYHLRLLSVQYVSSGGRADSLFEKLEDPQDNSDDSDDNMTPPDKQKFDDAILEEAMKHAHESGTNHGVTRAMVIRSYPKAWHVFVDISPATDADFVVAATFDDEPSSEEVNTAIVECIEGSEREDEIVAQQMQEAFDIESGKLDIKSKDDQTDEDDDDDEEDDWYNLWTEDSI